MFSFSNILHTGFYVQAFNFETYFSYFLSVLNYKLQFLNIYYKQIRVRLKTFVENQILLKKNETFLYQHEKFRSK